jgi:hypothetical protein
MELSRDLPYKRRPVAAHFGGQFHQCLPFCSSLTTTDSFLFLLWMKDDAIGNQQRNLLVDGGTVSIFSTIRQHGQLNANFTAE